MKTVKIKDCVVISVAKILLMQSRHSYYPNNVGQPARARFLLLAATFINSLAAPTADCISQGFFAFRITHSIASHCQLFQLGFEIQ